MSSYKTPLNNLTNKMKGIEMVKMALENAHIYQPLLGNIIIF